MTTYRVGGDPGHPDIMDDQGRAVAAVFRGDQALAARICALLNGEVARECAEETRSWDHFTPEQMDSYWIRCTLSGPHDEHKDENTGLTWRTPRDGDAPSSPLSTPVSAERPPAGGPGPQEGAETLSGGAVLHRPEVRGSDSEGYGRCTGCGAGWPCAAYRGGTTPAEPAWHHGCTGCWRTTWHGPVG